LGSSASDGGQQISDNPRRFHYELKLDVRGVYDDNINLSPSAAMSDYYIRIEPSVTVGFGDITQRSENFLRASYFPHVLLFLDNDNLNTVEHLFVLDAQYRLSRLTFVLSEEIALLESSELSNFGTQGSVIPQVNLDISGRSRVNTFHTRLNGNYDLTGKTAVTFSGEHLLSDPENNIQSQTIEGTLGVSWQYSQKIVLGIHGLGGLTDVENASNSQTFEQLNVTASYNATGKITANGSVGVEVRQFEDRGENITPVFQLGLTYAPFDGTSITGNASRRIFASGTLANQDFESTMLQVSVRQRLIDRFTLLLSGGFQNQTYFSTIEGLAAGREDNYYFIAPAIDVRITNYWSAGVFYQHRQNSSSFDAFGFKNDQFGFRTGLNF
jgi:uncharacterized protein (PEP-CTERM system associated)